MSKRGWEIRFVAPERAGPPGRHRGPLADDLRRLLLVLLFAACLAAAGTVDATVARVAATTVPSASPGSEGPSASIVAPAVAGSSAWFCIGGIPGASTPAVTLELTNPLSRPVAGTVSTVLPSGAQAQKPVSVSARSQLSVAPTAAGGGAWAAATVVLDSGGVGVFEIVSGSLGWSAAPCASSTSTSWYFAHGSTASGSSLSLCVYNPLSTDAVVDVALDSSTSGLIEPPAYQGIPVPARSVVVENLGDHLLDDSSAGTEVTTSSGSVVAFEVQDTPEPMGGGSPVLLGLRQPAARWEFPATTDPAGGYVVFYVLNPTPRRASVEADIALSEGEAEPLRISVPPFSVGRLEADQQTRIPPGSPYEIAFRASTPVVVDREMLTAAGSPAPQFGQVQGASGGYSRFVLPALSPPSTSVQAVAIAAAGPRPAQVALEEATAHGMVRVFRAPKILPGHPLLLVGPQVPALGSSPWMVVSTAPVEVEVDAGPSGSPGVVSLPALPSG